MTRVRQNCTGEDERISPFFVFLNDYTRVLPESQYQDKENFHRFSGISSGSHTGRCREKEYSILSFTFLPKIFSRAMVYS